MVGEYFRHNYSHSSCNRNLHVGYINDGKRNKRRCSLLIYADINEYFRHNYSHSSYNRKLHVGFINDGERNKRRHNLLIYAVISDTLVTFC